MFLASLIDRALDGRTAIAPRRASRYEIDVNMAEPSWGEAEIQHEAAPRPATDRSVTLKAVQGAMSPSAVEAPRAARAVQPAAPATLPPSTIMRDHAEPPPLIVTRLEQLAPRVEPMAQAEPRPTPTAAPAEAAAAGIRELHTHERLERL